MKIKYTIDMKTMLQLYEPTYVVLNKLHWKYGDIILYHFKQIENYLNKVEKEFL